MALVNFKEMLADASRGGYAVGMFDVSDLDMIRADQFRLPDAPENTASSGSSIALIRRDEPIFDREQMGGF